MKKKILVAIFVAWVVLWLSFTARELFRKGHLYDYAELATRSLEGKRSYVSEDRFYEFLVFCNARLPESASYRLLGVDPVSHAQRRASYYLYPHLEEGGAGFVLVYDEPAAPKEGYEVFAILDDTRYILKERPKGRR